MGRRDNTNCSFFCTPAHVSHNDLCFQTKDALSSVTFYWQWHVASKCARPPMVRHIALYFTQTSFWPANVSIVLAVAWLISRLAIGTWVLLRLWVHVNNVCTVQLKCDSTRWRKGGEVKGKLANGVGSQYSSHYLGTWFIQYYYSWCAHSAASSQLNWRPRRFNLLAPEFGI